MSGLIDLTGKVFGRLTIIRRVGTAKGNKPTWECLCECGNTTIVRAGDIMRGHTKSCGCLNRETVTNLTHGDTRGGKWSPEYTTWANMIQRCTDRNHHSYKYYGGVGISVCDAWLADYTVFREHMGPRPKNMTLDRIDSTRGYEPGNCRWLSVAGQNRNKPSNKLTIHKANRIREFLWCGISVRELANYYSVSGTMIYYIKNGKSWLPDTALSDWRAAGAVGDEG